MPYGPQKSNATVGKTNPKLADVIIRSRLDRMLKSGRDSFTIFRVNGVKKTFEWNRGIFGVEAMQAKGFVRQMKHLPCVEIGRPTADVRQTLCFREVCLVPAQLLRQQLLLGYIHTGTEKAFEDSLFDNPHAHAANVAHLAVGTHYACCDVAPAFLFQHQPDRFRH